MRRHRFLLAKLPCYLLLLRTLAAITRFVPETFCGLLARSFLNVGEREFFLYAQPYPLDSEGGAETQTDPASLQSRLLGT